jgi:hypothetical protein
MNGRYVMKVAKLLAGVNLHHSHVNGRPLSHSHTLNIP